MSHPQGNWPPFGQPLYITQGDGQVQPAYAQQTQGAPQPYGTSAPTQPQPPTATWQQGAYPTFAQQLQQLGQPAQPTQQTYTVVYQGAPPAFHPQQPMYHAVPSQPQQSFHLAAPPQPQQMFTPPAATPQQPTTAAPFQPQQIFTPPVATPQQPTTPAAPFQPQHPATDAATSSDQLKMTRQQWQELLRAEHAEAQAQKAPSPVLTGLQQSSFAEPSASPAPEPRQQLPTRRLVESRADISGLRKLLNGLTVDGGEQSESAPKQDDEQSEPELQSSTSPAPQTEQYFTTQQAQAQALQPQSEAAPQQLLQPPAMQETAQQLEEQGALTPLVSDQQSGTVIKKNRIPETSLILILAYPLPQTELQRRYEAQFAAINRMRWGTDPTQPNAWVWLPGKIPVIKCCWWHFHNLMCKVPGQCPNRHAEFSDEELEQHGREHPGARKWCKEMRLGREIRDIVHSRRE
ncbi:hypothetical protein IWZ01DRAFT_566366 [Phyllosticta capitalensis]